MKKMGQHFLIDSRVLKRIVEYSGAGKKDLILEIGAGTGNLTAALAAKAKKVYAIELDYELAVNLERQFSGTNVAVIKGDALKLKFPEFNKAVANLPYYISSDLTFKLLQHRFELAVLMYQKEFAERMVAQPKSEHYGRLSVTAQHRASIEILEIVPKNAFQPVPEVDSAIVRLKPKKPDYEVTNEAFFLKVVTACFSKRRKKLRNAIISAAAMLEISETDLKAALQKLPHMEQRAEELSACEFAALANELIEYCK